MGFTKGHDRFGAEFTSQIGVPKSEAIQHVQDVGEMAAVAAVVQLLQGPDGRVTHGHDLPVEHRVLVLAADGKRVDPATGKGASVIDHAGPVFQQKRTGGRLFTLPLLHVGSQFPINGHLPGSRQPVDPITNRQAFQGGDVDAARFAAAERTAFTAGRFSFVWRSSGFEVVVDRLEPALFRFHGILPVVKTPMLHKQYGKR